MERRFAFLATALLFVAGLGGCTYVGLFRPNVLKQLNPEVAELINELPNVDRPNEEMVGRLFAHGGLSHAREDADGIMRDEITVPSGQMIWKPSIVVMPRPGVLELDIANQDEFVHHAAVLPSNGDKQFMMLPIHARGRARIELNGPGYYWFGCPVGNHAGRGMLGLIIVRGDTPPEARLDRPAQRRP